MEPKTIIHCVAKDFKISKKFLIKIKKIIILTFLYCSVMLASKSNEMIILQPTFYWVTSVILMS